MLDGDLDLTAPLASPSERDGEFHKPPVSVDDGTEAFPEACPEPQCWPVARKITVHNCQIAEDKTWHSWVEFGDYVHRCCCGAVEAHHRHMLALSRGEA